MLRLSIIGARAHFDFHLLQSTVTTSARCDAGRCIAHTVAAKVIFQPRSASNTLTTISFRHFSAVRQFQRHNIAMLCLFETCDAVPVRFIVATTHLYWDPNLTHGWLQLTEHLCLISHCHFRSQTRSGDSFDAALGALRCGDALSSCDSHRRL